MFTNIIKRDRNRVRLELSNRDPAVSALPRFSKYFSQLSFAAGAARNFYLYLNPAVKSGTTEVLASVAGNLCDTWQGPEYFIRPTLCHTETQIFHIWVATPGADLNI